MIKKRTAISLLLVILLCLSGSCVLHDLGVLHDLDIRVVEDLNGEKSLKPHVTVDSLNEAENQRVITLSENGQSKDYSLADLGIKSALINTDVVDHYKIELNNLQFNYDYTGLDDFVNKLNETRQLPIQPVIEKGASSFELSESEPTNYIDIEKLRSGIKENLEQHTSEKVELNLSDYYLDDYDATSLENVVNHFNNFGITYVHSEFIPLIDFIDYFDTNGETIKFNDELSDDFESAIKERIKDVLSGYNTKGKLKDFQTSNGDTIDIEKGTYGNTVDTESEALYVIDVFKNFNNFESEITGRIPEYKEEMPSDFSTYVEVSIKDQKAWFYADGKLDSEDNVVTGWKGRHDTPTGIYYIINKANGTYLTGPTWRTWVDKWMRITTNGIGLHDASWRKTFGDNIYTYNGSHGCINLPKAFAYNLYDKADVLTPVIIY